jgi:hypothetical protein
MAATTPGSTRPKAARAAASKTAATRSAGHHGRPGAGSATGGRLRTAPARARATAGRADVSVGESSTPRTLGRSAEREREPEEEAGGLERGFGATLWVPESSGARTGGLLRRGAAAGLGCRTGTRFRPAPAASTRSEVLARGARTRPPDAAGRAPGRTAAGGVVAGARTTRAAGGGSARAGGGAGGSTVGTASATLGVATGVSLAVGGTSGVTAGGCTGGGSGAGAGEGAGAGAGSGTGSGTGAGGTRFGRRPRGSTYPCGSDSTRTPRWTYGSACSASPLDPMVPTVAPSTTETPAATPIEPRCTSVTA